MAKKITRLSFVMQTKPDDSVLVAQKGPALIDGEDEDLICGACSAVIGESISVATVLERVRAKVRLVVACSRCRAFNIVRAASYN
jgi:hypothetical protein